MTIILSKQTLVKEILISNLKKICSKYNFATFDKELNNLEKDFRFIKKINQKINSNNHFKKRYFNSVYDFSVYRNMIYVLLRLVKPSIVVETGVLHGLTTSWILKALNDNKKGKLISIDIKRSDWKKFFKKKMGPGYKFDEDFPKNEEPGWVIPDYLKKNWKLIYGPSNKKLKLIKQKIDFFIHDSDHSYENVKFEIESVLKKNPKSWLVIDNYDFNSFSFDFLGKNFVKKKSFTYSIIDEVDDNLTIEESAILLKKK